MRLFVAVWPPAQVAAALAQIPIPDVRRVAVERLHVTLRFLGSVEDGEVPALVAALRSGVLLDSPVVASLGPATATFGRHVLHVPVHGLERAAEGVARACRGFGEPAEDRPFVGHLTLARSRRGGPDLRASAGTPVPALAQEPWPVGEVTLVRSAGGSYEVLERLPVG